MRMPIIKLLNNEYLDQQDVLDMVKYARHIHVAGDGKDIDTCKKCGHDFRYIIHLRYGEND